MPVDHSNPCPLCDAKDNTLFYQDRHRPYLRCGICQLVYVPSAHYLSPENEKAEYDLHENQVTDAGYRRFLNRLWEPMQNKLQTGDQVLDFGCGPGPALGAMMEEAGMKVSLYDHFYFPNTQVLKTSTYEGITSTEVIEHLHQPGEVFLSWVNMLKAGGWLGIMTKLVKDQAAFAQWHYKNDRTHVCFFSRQTFQWLAQQHGLSLTFYGDDVMIMGKE